MGKTPEPDPFPYPKPQGKRPMKLALTAEQVIKAVNAYYAQEGAGFNIPDTAACGFDVPSGGDFSSTTLQYHMKEDFMTITWEE